MDSPSTTKRVRERKTRMKRSRENEEEGERPRKAIRLPAVDRLSRLSDELLVRILSFCTVPTLLLCQRLSNKFSHLAVDSELWKAAYYRNFVLPRASRIPGIKDSGTSNHLHYSSKLSRWLEDGYLVKNGRQTDWKQQYRLRHNWSQGQCAVSEIVVAERPPEPPLLVMMHNGRIYTADSMSGLRVWSSQDERQLMASTTLVSPETKGPRLPTSMAVDSREDSEGHQGIVLGFEDGSFTIYTLKEGTKDIQIIFNHTASSNGMLSALAYCSPYLLTMTEDHLLSLYSLSGGIGPDGMLESPELLYSLRSHTAWPPVSLSLRTASTSMTAAIAYAIPTYLSGWTVGIQEMRFSLAGCLIESRIATAATEQYHTIAGQSLSSSPGASPSPERSGGRQATGSPSSSKPTSMSYSHPYLLVAHPDNTLTLYLVKSTSTSLTISSGSRLWGHTSSVSGAHVGMRGKAVSVSRLGDELRVWDLEGGMASLANRKRSMNGELSVRIQPARIVEEQGEMERGWGKASEGLRFALERGLDDRTVSRGWVGFDEQNVIVLREKEEGSQALVVYDFS